MPGFIDSWTFPPPGSTGIFQSVTVDRCETLLWPMLVRENSTVVLRDISEDNWIVVGFHMPNDGVVEDLFNDRFYADHTLDLEDREFRLVNASIDTWNLYPQADAHVTVRDSHLGEILSLENSRVWMERTTIDGTGGFFGARDTLEDHRQRLPFHLHHRGHARRAPSSSARASSIPIPTIRRAPGPDSAPMTTAGSSPIRRRC